MVLNLEMIEKSSKTLDGAALAAYGRRWLPALVEELRETRATITELRERNGRLVAVLHTDEAEIERLRTLMGWQPEDGRKSWPGALHNGGESNE